MVYTNLTVDLSRGAAVYTFPSPLGSGDYSGNIIVLRCVRYDKAADLTGHGAAVYINRADKTTVRADGSIDGSNVIITLPLEAYAVTGEVTMAVKVGVSGSSLATVCWLHGSVGRTSFGTVIESDGSTGDTVVTVTGAVRYDIAQNLTDAQKAQARANIGVSSDGGTSADLIDDTATATDKVWSSFETNSQINAASMALMELQGADYLDLNNKIGGDLTQLKTDDKSSLLAAVNELHAEVDSLAAGDTPASGSPVIEAWGDSLTIGAGAATVSNSGYDYDGCYPQVLAELIGQTVKNYGVGGENIETILGRMGALPMLVMPSGSASGDGGSDDAFQNVEYWTNQTPFTQTVIDDNMPGGVVTYGEGGTYSLFAAAVEAGKTYQLGVKHADGWKTQNTRKLAFSSTYPVHDADAGTYIFDMVGTVTTATKEAFTVPTGARYVIFTWATATFDAYVAAGFPVSLQEINDEHPELSDTVSAAAAISDTTDTAATVIPATVTAARLYGGIQSITGAAAAPLLQSASAEKGLNPCVIGGIEGTLAYVDEDSSGNALAEPYYTFTRSTAGNAMTIDRPTPIITSYAESKDSNRILLLWIGQNNAQDEVLGEDNAAFVERLIDANRTAISYVGTDRYIIIGTPIDRPTEHDTAVYYDALYKRMQYVFGAHYINITDYLLAYGLDDAGITPTDEDTANIAIGRVPESLRSDGVHLNAKGYAIVARQVYERGKLLGYW